MIGRFAIVLASSSFAIAAAPASASDLYAQLFPLTGEVRLLNKSDTDIPFVFYSISSEGGALDSSSAVWKSITENYDRPAGATPGNGLIDPNGDWVELVMPNELAEGALDLDGGRLPAFRSVSLGNIWNPFAVPFPDLEFQVWNDFELLPVSIELALAGDYSSDQVVDAADYLAWQKFLDSMTAYFADGDLDGSVDADDYLVWQENFGLTLPLPPYIAGQGGGNSLDVWRPFSVPEPSSVALLLLATSAAASLYRRRRR